MATPEQTLRKVENLLAVGKAAEPQQLLTDLVRQMSQTALSSWRADLLKTIEKFQPKRRKALLELVDRKTATSPSSVRESMAQSYGDAEPTSANLPGEDAFRRDLSTLSDHHIFQWSSHYDACLTRHFDSYLAQLQHGPTADDYADSARRLLQHHALDIFSKGWGHQVGCVGESATMQKSMGGLARFLDLPLAYYSARASDAMDKRSVQALRLLFSSAVFGILEGYGSVRFGVGTGAGVLPHHFKRIAHHLAFLTPAVADQVANLIANGEVLVGLRRTTIPLLESLDKLILKDHEDYYPLPIFGRYLEAQGRFEVGVRPPQSITSRHAIEAHAYFGHEHVTPHVLDEALARRVALVLAPLSPDVAAHVSSNALLEDMVVEAHDGLVIQDAVHAWDRAIYALRSKLARRTPYNVAREFPLREPVKAKFYHVKRTSVRDLLRTFDRKNGVRLWCSVRRSGKTTACFDLDFTAGDSAIVPQTCGTEPAPRGRLFYDRVCEAATSQEAIAKDFLAEIVGECAPVSVEDGQRIVFVVDEYETLFGYLKAVTENNSLLRYTVVQPLLNQLVEFAHDNLLVFLGQQPDAHFILMDQNQLAPYVEQDPFPLFEHIEGTGAGEFGLLVSKILTDRIEASPKFLDSLHRETAGHPFLTANVLCVFVDWLIEQERPLRGLRLRERHFRSFREQKLGVDQLTLYKDYSFFREAARQAMSEAGYHSNRWLYTVYWALCQITTTDDVELSVSRSDFLDLMGLIPAPGPLPDAHEVLRTASQANFLSLSDDQVAVKIRTLGRLATSVRPVQT